MYKIVSTDLVLVFEAKLYFDKINNQNSEQVVVVVNLFSL